MTTLLYAHPLFAAHETPRGHPEHGGRVQAIEKALEADEFATLVRREAPKASPRALERVHPKKHVDAIVAVAPREGLVQLDPDTFMGPTSLEAALRAAGAGVAAVDAIFAGEATNAFVACRPPGHHATPDRAMGFCLFNNVAVAAMHARAAHGARRIAVVDFDVHHGNGTEVAFWHDEGAFFASSHQWPQYPGTGRESDRGAYDNIVNAPLPGGSGSEAFRKAWSERLLPALAEFRPDFIGVSAGFDAHRADPIGGLALVEDDYAWVTAEIVSVARSACRSRLVSFLEGGYDLAALAASGAAHVRVLMAA